MARVFPVAHGGRKRILGVQFSGGKRKVLRRRDAVAYIFFRVPRSDSGLDSDDSCRIGLGPRPVGSCRLPLKVRGRLTRLGIDASDPGFGLILGDFFAGWFMVGNANFLRKSF